MNRLLPLSLFVLMLFASAAHGANYTVNSAADTTDGTCDAANCTLREAINAVNADGGGSISFAIGSGPATINILTEMPALSAPVVLDATTQPGYAGTPIIRLRSTSHVAAAITILAGDTTVRGFDIGDVGRGIDVAPVVGISNIAIERNFIATDPAAPLTGDKYSIFVHEEGNGSITNLTIGNADPSGRNVLGGARGIFLSNSAVQCVVAGNYLGIADDGSTPLPPVSRSTGDALINVTGISSGNILIGGTTASARNVISSGSQDGIRVLIGQALTLIEGNFIGLDASGNLARPNATGIELNGTHNAVIANNVIAGGGNGINLASFNTGSIIRGNLIGTNATGNNVLATGVPIRVQDSTFTTIGGTTPADRNIIDGASVNQIEITGFTSNTVVAGNYIGLTPSGMPGSSYETGVFVVTSDPTGNNVIGGSVPGAGNVIAGSTVGAIRLLTDPTVKVLGNLIGTNPAGTAALPTSGYGIRITNGSHVIGGAGANEGNPHQRHRHRLRHRGLRRIANDSWQPHRHGHQRHDEHRQRGRRHPCHRHRHVRHDRRDRRR
jgi:CSLREA domain-containing protein